MKATSTVLLFLVLFIVGSASSQAPLPIPNYEQIIADSVLSLSGEERIKSLESLVVRISEDQMMDIKSIHKVMDFDYPTDKGLISYAKAYVMYLRDLDAEAEEFIRTELERNNSLTPEEKALLLSLQGSVLKTIERPIDAYTAFSEADEYFNLTSPSSSSYRNRFGLLKIQKDLGLFDECISNIAINLVHYESTFDSIQIGKCYNLLGIVYRKMEDYDRAISSHEAALEMRKLQHDSTRMAISFYNLGKCYKETSRFDKALELFEKAQSIYKSKVDDSRLASTISNIAGSYHDQGMFELAEKKYLEAIEIKKKLNKDISIASTFNDLGQLYMDSGTPLKSKVFLKNAENIYSRHNESQSEAYLNNLSLLSRFYEKLNPALSLEYYKKYSETYSRRLNEKKIEAAQIADIRFETQKKVAEISRLNESNEQKQKDLRLQKWIIGLVSIFLIAALVIAVILQRLNKQKTLANFRIKALNKEIHHRIKNNLQLLSDIFSLEARQTSDPEAKATMHSSQSRVQAMNLVHQKLFKANESLLLDLGQYISEMSENLRSAFSPDSSLILEIEKTEISVNKGISVGLIVNEILTNSYKYGVKGSDGSITVQVKNLPKDKISITIRDNGPGYNENKIPSPEGSGFGMRMIRLLSKQLKAEITFSNDRGAVAQLIL